ncbi:uncharacterized protein [Narcine bancroftii]|uniref:uncharacterized protein n=1 Tax=Narcine bancroftii TaxID=1343680 RepID=UPI00383168FE
MLGRAGRRPLGRCARAPAAVGTVRACAGGRWDGARVRRRPLGRCARAPAAVGTNEPQKSVKTLAGRRRSENLSTSFLETFSTIIVDEFQESEEDLIHLQSEVINKTFFAQFLNLKASNEVTNLKASNEIDLEHLARILEHGADVNFSDKEGHTVLHEVARNWNVDVAQFLLERGADVNRQDIFGRTPLHVAAATNNVEMIVFLIQNGAKVDIVSDGDLLTPMHCAAKYDAFEALICLYDHHANIHKRDFRKRTPLHLAAANGYSDSAMMLLKMGANATVEDDTGFSCLMEMIIKMPTVAKYALDQLHIIDETGKKQHYYLKYLTPTSDVDNKRVYDKTLLEVVLINKCFAVVEHPVLKKLIDLKWKSYGLKTNLLLIIMDLIFISSWSLLLILHKLEINYNLSKDLKLLPLSIFCIGEMLYVIFAEIREFLSLRNAMCRWKNSRKDQMLREQVYCHSHWPQEEINLKKEIAAIDSMKDYYFLDWWHAHDCIVLSLLFVVVCTQFVALGLTGNIKIFHDRLIAFSLIPLWLKNMKHLRAFRFIGPFIIIIPRMMFNIAKFLFLYFEFFFAFAYSIWLIFAGTLELQTLDESLFLIFRISVHEQWQLVHIEDEDVILAYIIIGTFISIMSFLCFSLFTALLSNAYIRIHDNLNASVLMLRVSIILQAEKRWHTFLHKNKFSGFTLEHYAPLEVRCNRMEKQRRFETFACKETKAEKEGRLLEFAFKIKEVLGDSIDIVTGFPKMNKEESRINLLQPRPQSKSKKLVVLQKEIWRLRQGVEVLQSQQEIIDEELQKDMDILLKNMQRMCELHHNRGLTDSVLTKKEYQLIQSRESLLRQKLQSVNSYLRRKSAIGISLPAWLTSPGPVLLSKDMRIHKVLLHTNHNYAYISKEVEHKKHTNQHLQTDKNLDFTKKKTVV